MYKHVANTNTIQSIINPRPTYETWTKCERKLKKRQKSGSKDFFHPNIVDFPPDFAEGSTLTHQSSNQQISYERDSHPSALKHFLLAAQQDGCVSTYRPKKKDFIANKNKSACLAHGQPFRFEIIQEDACMLFFLPPLLFEWLPVISFCLLLPVWHPYSCRL